ncbi:SDR family NAD(P)-dependent oxidoreductase [Lichenicola sp.]|uniref:SDR family NAD(P)-dependent oxidoreductase n=1 Tax=Lichenicola sp. TaxID=2804529 RepID=UPI003B002AF4
MSDSNRTIGVGRTALFVGASRGLGLGLVQQHLARGWKVIATVRKPSDALHALSAEAGDSLVIETLDMNEPAQLEALADRLGSTRLDLLFVNAGVAHDPSQTIGSVSDEQFFHILRTNTLSPMRVVERLEGLVPSPGTIAVMSSSLGSVAMNETGGYETYRASKAALDTLLRSVAARRKDSRRTFLAVDPGWVRTDMGGPGANLDVETSTSGVTGMLEARRGTPGVFFVTYANKELPW